MSGLGDLKEVAKVLRAADKINEYQTILDAQEKLLEQQEKISELKKEINRLRESKKFTFAKGEKFLIDLGEPDRKLCPLCTKKHSTAIPLDENIYCTQCKGDYA